MKLHLLIRFLLERQRSSSSTQSGTVLKPEGRSSREAVFKHRPSWVLTVLLLNFGFLFSLTSSAQAAMRVVSGKYTGTGVDSRSLTGLGFQPDVVIIMSANTGGGNYAVCRTSSMSGDQTKILDSSTSGLSPNLIESLDSDGFKVGNASQVNTSMDDYYVIAFQAETGKMKVGSYTGNGTSQNYVIVLNGSGAGAVHSLGASGSSYTFDYGTPLTNGITALGSGSFTVSYDAYVNAISSTYYYIAFGAITNYEKTGNYTGNGSDNRNITDVGFQPEYVFIQDQSDYISPVAKHYSSGPSTDYSIVFDGYGYATNAIQQLRSDGFQVGTYNYVNYNGSSYSWVAFGRQTPTATRLASFSARDLNGAVLLEWQTGHEMDNLGFHIYREENGVRYRLTPEPVAGSALRSGPDNAMRAGRNYFWWDFPELSPQSSSLSPVRYWLEDIDLNGKRTLHGPIEIKTSAISDQRSALDSKHSVLSPRSSSLSAQSSVLLSKLGKRLEEEYRDFWRIEEFKEKRTRERERLGGIGAGALLEQRVKRFGRLKDWKGKREGLEPKWSQNEVQSFLAGRPAVKILVKEEGWYRITQPELVAAGLSPKVDPWKLRLYVDGQERPIRVIGEKNGRFGPRDAIEFYGTGLDTPSTDTRVYWLVEGLGPGKRIKVLNGISHLLLSKGRERMGGSFPYTVEKKERKLYFAALRNGEADNFFGPVIASSPVDQLLNIRHLAPSSPQDALLEISLQGMTKAPHRVKVLLNEAEVGEMAFEEQSLLSSKFTLPHSMLLEGENLVSLVAQEGPADVSLVDTIRLTYWHTYAADEDTLHFTATGEQKISVDGFSSPQVRVVDITHPQEVQEIKAEVKVEDEGYAVTFRVPGRGSRTLLVFTEDRVKKAAAMKPNQPSALSWKREGADLVIISHKDFIESLGPLKALRESQGYSVVLTDVEDIYDEFSFGHKDPQAVKDFLKFAKEYWLKTPRFVLLVGDASFDPRNYLGLGDYDFVPTKIIETASMETASDDWFVTYNNDGPDGASKMPEMAMGRLPVRTVEEAELVISKIVGYEQAAAEVVRDVVLVADRTEVGDGFDFQGASEQVGGLLPNPMGVQKIYRGDFGSDAEARRVLIKSLNEGPLVVNYIGHGSEGIWNGNLLTSEDARLLTNGRRLPLVIGMTCLNGIFHDVYAESLAEALLKAPGGGAVAVWASSGFTEPSEQTAMNKEIIQHLFNGEQLTLGEAALKAKAAATDWDVRRTWILFGDPTTRLKDR